MRFRKKRYARFSRRNYRKPYGRIYYKKSQRRKRRRFYTMDRGGIRL